MVKRAKSWPFGIAAFGVNQGKRGRTPVVVLAALGLAALACNPSALLGGSGQPTVSILSPAAGSSVLVGEPVSVQVSAIDSGNEGISSIDLQVNSVTVNSAMVTCAAKTACPATLSWTPSAEGTVTLTVIAHRPDGVSSPPATIALTVEAEGGEAPPAGETDSQEGAGTGGGASSEVRVEARADLDANIRAAPGIGCPILGVWTSGDTGTFLERTTHPTEYWYKTDYLGENTIGWVYHEAFTLLGDDSILPRVPSEGCLFCGDGVCSAEIAETCNTCASDCGACCGNGACEPEYGEGCDVCEADCGLCAVCGNGEIEEDEECDVGGCDAGYECVDCACVEVPATCGDGVVNQPSELCDGDDGCWEGATCAPDCSQCLTEEAEPVCGDGVVNQPSELCDGDDGCWEGAFCDSDCSQCLTVHP